MQPISIVKYEQSIGNHPRSAEVGWNLGRQQHSQALGEDAFESRDGHRKLGLHASLLSDHHLRGAWSHSLLCDFACFFSSHLMISKMTYYSRKMKKMKKNVTSVGGDDACPDFSLSHHAYDDVFCCYCGASFCPYSHSFCSCCDCASFLSLRTSPGVCPSRPPSPSSSH